MNSDEDPSFPFICEGPSGVLAIFGETSGVLPDMSTSAEVADLEDVFAKASMPIQDTQSDSQENTVTAKSSADVLSEFQGTVLAASEGTKKTDELNTPSVLTDSVKLSEEIPEGLIESTLADENTVLVPEVDTVKVIQEDSTAVTGSVELAEEIMEAFANSKNVLDSETPVSNDPSTLEEELARLEQLAVERVREIEGELVNSSKQITECNLSLDVPKEPKATEANANMQKEFESEMVVPDSAETATKEVGDSFCDDVVATVDLTSPSELVSVVPEIPSVGVSVEEEKVKSSNLDLTESMADNTTVQENESGILIGENSKLIGTNTLETEKTAELRSESKSGGAILDRKDKIDNAVAEEQGESSNVVSKLKKTVNYSDIDLEAEVKIKSSKSVEKTDNMVCDTKQNMELAEEKKNNVKDRVEGLDPIEERQFVKTDGENKELNRVKDGGSDADVKVEQESIREKPYVPDISDTNKNDTNNFANPNKDILESGETTSAAHVAEDKKIKDMQNYETEDDDLEVLEAFIVKTATNPELAVCSVQSSKVDCASKYSLESVESALLDDLTKTDNGSANEAESKSENINEGSSFSGSLGGDSAQEKISEKIASQVDSSDTSSKPDRNTTGHKSEKHASSVSDKKMSEKKNSGDELASSSSSCSSSSSSSSSSTAKGSSRKTEKKVVFVEVKRRTGRSLISGKKGLSRDSSAVLRKETSIGQTASEKRVSDKEVNEEKSAKHDENAIKTNIKNSKKIQISEESIPSTSGIILNQQVTEKSPTRSEGKMQKKQMEQNIDKPTASSKSTLKITENKREDRTATVKVHESPSKEKKKPKDIKSNNEEKAMPCVTLETVSDKKCVESDSIAKSNKKDERKLKENVETPINRNMKGGSNNSDVTNSRSTRSGKKIVMVKIPQSTVLSELSKEKDKENVEKLTHSAVGDGGVKRQTEITEPKETFSKPDKSDKGQHKSLEEDATVTKKITDESAQASVTPKRRAGDVEGLPDTQASTSTTDKRTEKDSNKESANSKVSCSTLDRKTAEENLPDSSSAFKRKRTEDTEDSLSNERDSPSTVKRIRGETEMKEIAAEVQITSRTLKGKRDEAEIVPSSPATEVTSPTTLKQRKIEREFEQKMSNVGIEFSSRDDPTRTNLQSVSNVYSDYFFVEFEDITFEMLRSKAKQLVLPTPLWGVQVSSEKDLVAFSRLRADPSDDQPMVDKALVFQGSLNPIALINNEPVDLPIPLIRTFEDVVMLVRNFHSVSFCDGTGVKQRPQSKYCFRYVDVANPDGRCSQCLEERRRVLIGCARKLREKINVMKAAKGRQ